MKPVTEMTDADARFWTRIQVYITQIVHRSMRYLTAILVILLIGGCSSVPEKIRREPPSAPHLAEVLTNPQGYIGKQVRWGGTISRLENHQDETRIEIVARPLYGDGEPRSEDRSEGRFIVIIPGFLDPAIYAVDRNLTIVGQVSGSIERSLGAMKYRYPLVKGEAYHLWPKSIEQNRSYDPWLYDPWYPYPWGRYPYY